MLYWTEYFFKVSCKSTYSCWLLSGVCKASCSKVITTSAWAVIDILHCPNKIASKICYFSLLSCWPYVMSLGLEYVLKNFSIILKRQLSIFVSHERKKIVEEYNVILYMRIVSIEQWMFLRYRSHSCFFFSSFFKVHSFSL